MDIYINDMSFKYRFFDLEEAIGRIRDFIKICKRIESNECSNVKKIRGGIVDCSFDIINGKTLKAVINMLRDPDEKRYFFGLILNRDIEYVSSDISVFMAGGNISYICYYARNDGVVSLLSNKMFEDSVLKGTIDDEDVHIRNISNDSHFNEHRFELGIRRYHGNSEKHKKGKENYYGKKAPASPMDLDDYEAQQLLNIAVDVDGRLYAKKKGKYYAFQNEQDNIYHGYITNDLNEKIIREIDRKNWN